MGRAILLKLRRTLSIPCHPVMLLLRYMDYIYHYIVIHTVELVTAVLCVTMFPDKVVVVLCCCVV